MLHVPHAFAVSFGLMAFTTFVYDTLDVCTRLGRYIIQELTGLHELARPLAGHAADGRRAAVLRAANNVDANGQEPMPVWRMFWALFGASNQLLAALTLLGVTVWLWRTRRNPLVWLITGVPTVFMYTMSTWALVTMTLPQFYRRRIGPLLGADRSGAVGRRRADRAGRADARRSGAGNPRPANAADVVQAGSCSASIMPLRNIDRPDHLNRLAAFERARLGVKFGPAFDRHDERPLDVFFRGDDVAHPQADQVGRRNIRLRQVDDDFDHRAAQAGC